MRAPSPRAEPIFGHARILARDPLRTLVRWMEELGPVVRFRVGRREGHVVFEPEAIRRVLSDPDGIYGKDTHGYRTLRLFVGDGLLTSDGPHWVAQRRVLQPAFHKQTLGRQATVMRDVARRFADRMSCEDRPIRIDDVAMRTTFDVVTHALLGSDLGTSAGAVAAAIGALQVAANRRITAAIALPFAAPTPEHIRIRLARRRLRRLLADLIALRRRSRRGDDEADAVDLLLRAAGSDESILDELVTLLIAGHESTANALTWTIATLARHPEVLAWIREELDAAEETTTELPRLRAAIDETLRLYPPAWSFGRAPVRDDVVAGFSFPAGHLVMIAPWATHRRPSVFACPEEFRPARFLEDPPPPFSYLPFGGGPRTCIGHAFAKLEARIVLAEWLRRLDFDLLPGQDLEPVPLITLRPRRRRSGARTREGAMMRTTLYEKLFIDGFQKPSYVVVTIMLERPPCESRIRDAAIRTLAIHPRLRSMVRTRLGVPVAFVPRAPDAWKGICVHEERIDLPQLEERLLGTPLDLRREQPLEVHVLRDPAAIVVKIHHAVVDGASGFRLLHDFAHAFDGAEVGALAARPLPRVARLRDWLRRTQLRPRVPDASVVASFRPAASLERAPVQYGERLLVGAYARITRAARARGATFSELVASALLSAMDRYNVRRVAQPPARVGLMFARARPRRASADAAFRADTCIVSVPRTQLEAPHHPATLAELRRRASDDRHNDLALAALYARRKILGPPPPSSEETALTFTLSDLTAFGRGSARARSPLAMTGIRVLASPTSFDHAGMIVTRFGDDARLSVVAHRGALDSDFLLDLTQAHLERS